MRLRQSRVRHRREADLTGLINIVFLMLIFFIVAGALRPFSARDIELAKIEPDAGSSVAPSQLIAFEDGRITWRGVEIDLDQLEASVPVDAGRDTMIVVADGRLDAARLMDIVRRLRAAGHRSVAVMSERARRP
ncbi:MAG: biopolymer transporter ExbD [Pseudomonadota bacterium]